MSQEELETFIRTILKVGGGALIAQGILTDSTLSEVLGLAGPIAGLIWGWVRAKQAAAHRAVAEGTK